MKPHRPAPDAVFTTASPEMIEHALGILEPMLHIAERRAASMTMRLLHSLRIYKAKVDSPVSVTTVLSADMRTMGHVRAVVKRTASLTDPMPSPGRTPTETNGSHHYDLSCARRGSSRMKAILSIRQFGAMPETGERRIDHLRFVATMLGTIVDALRTAAVDGRRIADPRPISHAATERTIRAEGGEIPMMDLGPSLSIRTSVVDTAWPSPTAPARVGMIDEDWKHSQAGEPMDIALPTCWTMRVSIHEDTLIVGLDQTITSFEHDRDPVKTIRGEAILAALPASG